jgi:hypothetical protein
MDIGSTLQFVASFLAGTGLTALATAYYERREQRKERTRDYFRELVLTSDFFRFMTQLWQVCQVVRSYAEIKEIGSTRLLKSDGSCITVKDTSLIENEYSKLIDEIYASSWKVFETGAYFLLPYHLRGAIGNASPEGLLEELKKQSSSSAMSQIVKDYRGQLEEIRKEIMDLLGLSVYAGPLKQM